MLTPEKVAAVRKLLSATPRLPQRTIAATVGVSRASVTGIATGRRPDYERQRRDQALRREADEALARGPFTRCPDCGGLVRTPCRACHVRASGAIGPTGPTRDPVGGCGLELRPDDRERYEEVRLRREQSEAAASPNTAV
jgi:hypothetical protein